MRKQIILSVLSLLFLISLAIAQDLEQRSYSISGQIRGIDSGTIKMLSENNDLLDSTEIRNGNFNIEGRISFPERRLFIITPGNWSFRGFVEEANIKYIIDTTGAQHYNSGNNGWSLIWRIKEKGTMLGEVYNCYMSETFDKYNPVLLSLKTKPGEVADNEEALTNKEREIDSVMILFSVAQKKWISNYIDHHPTSIAGAYIFLEYYQMTGLSLNDVELNVNKFTGNAKTSRYYEQLETVLNNLKNQQHGKLAPDFTLPRPDKIDFTLSSTRGSLTLIDFWASWCVPCRNAIPRWKNMYAKYHSKGFNIVSVSTDRDRNAWTRSLEKEQMPWVQVIDMQTKNKENRSVSELYQFRYLPFYVLLDKQGKVLIASGSEEEVVKKIEESFRY